MYDIIILAVDSGVGESNDTDRLLAPVPKMVEPQSSFLASIFSILNPEGVFAVNVLSSRESVRVAFRLLHLFACDL
eukprot:SAG31_NODE_3086_length_4691_cov_36.726916_3_plen_76_part_00